MRSLKLFVVADKTNDNTIVMTGTAYTRGAFVRSSIGYLSKVNPNFREEFVPAELCEIDEEELFIRNEDTKFFDWDVYKVPENPVEHVPVEHVPVETPS